MSDESTEDEKSFEKEFVKSNCIQASMIIFKINEEIKCALDMDIIKKSEGRFCDFVESLDSTPHESDCRPLSALAFRLGFEETFDYLNSESFWARMHMHCALFYPELSGEKALMKMKCFFLKGEKANEIGKDVENFFLLNADDLLNQQLKVLNAKFGKAIELAREKLGFKPKHSRIERAKIVEAFNPLEWSSLSIHEDNIQIINEIVANHYKNFK